MSCLLLTKVAIVNIRHPEIKKASSLTYDLEDRVRSTTVCIEIRGADMSLICSHKWVKAISIE